jgi:alpha-D-ribose 1-methylphosphonate 5-triphosphate synthase subunit PhnL
LGGKVIEGCAGISFALRPGEFLGVHGPSGTGKSTVLKCVYRTYRPTAGRLLYDSDAFGRIDLATAGERQILEVRRREASYVSQFLQVIPRVSAQEVVADPLIRRGFPADQARVKARYLLSLLRVPEELWEASPATFSGGQKQRVNLAQAVIGQPRLLLLDEPTASLDEEMQQVVLELLRDLKRQGTTMIGVFHDLDLMRQIADFTLSMVDGAVEAAA